MSGDSEEGTTYCTMVGGVLKANNQSENGNAKMFYTTNTYCYISLSDVEMIYPEGMDTFLLCACNTNQRGWGTAGANGSECVLYTIDQDIDGNIIYDTWSYLGCFLTQGTEMTGAFLCREDNGDRGCDVYMDGTAVWTVTGDSQVRDLYTAGDEILDDQGKTVSIVSADGTSYVDGDSDYTITVTGTYGTDDLTAFEHVPGIGTVADGEYTFEPQKAEEYVNLDYTPTAPDGTVYTEAAWGAEDEAPAEEPEESIVETRISAVESTVETEAPAPAETEIAAPASAEEEAPAATEQPAEKSNTPVVIAIIVILVAVIAAGCIVVSKKKKK